MNCLFGLSRRLNSIKNFRLLFNNFETNLNQIERKLPINTNQSFVRYLAFEQPNHRNRRSRTEAFESNNSLCEDLENRLTETRELGRPTHELLRKLLFSYCRRSQFFESENETKRAEIVNRVTQIWDELKQNQFLVSDAIYSSLLEFYTNLDDISTALEMKSKISKSFPLDSFKVFNLAALLVRKDRTSEAIELITEEINRRLGRFKRFDENREISEKFGDKSINRLLNAMIDKRVETKLIKKVFRMCVEISPVSLNKTIVGPLVKMHVINENYSLALEEFVYCAENYQLLPWSLELMRIFIQNNDKKSLDTVVYKSSELYGPNNTSLDLLAAYVYNGLIDEAKRIVKTIPKLQQQSIEFICDKFMRDRKVDELKNFIQVIQSVPGTNKELLFRILIKGYLRNGENDNAINVLNLMKEQNIEPTEHTLKLLDKI